MLAADRNRASPTPCARPGQERSFWALDDSRLLALGLQSGSRLVLRESCCTEPFPKYFSSTSFSSCMPCRSSRPLLGVRTSPKKEGKFHLSLLNFLMLMGWWIFLYAFIVFPHQYVVVNSALYNVYYNRLYVLQNVLLLAVLGLAAVDEFRRMAAPLPAFSRPSACCTPAARSCSTPRTQAAPTTRAARTTFRSSPPLRGWRLQSCRPANGIWKAVAPPCIRSGGRGSFRGSPC